MIFGSCLAYTICMGYFLLKVGDKENPTDKTKFEKMSLNTIYVPDAIFVVIYATLYWKVIQFYYEAHMQSGNLHSTYG